MSYGAPSACARIPRASQVLNPSHLLLTPVSCSLAVSHHRRRVRGQQRRRAKIRKYEEERASRRRRRSKEALAADASKSHIVNFASSRTEAIESAFKASPWGCRRRSSSRRSGPTSSASSRQKRRHAAADEDRVAREKDRKRKKQKEAKAKPFADDEDEFGGEEEDEEPAKKSGRSRRWARTDGGPISFPTATAGSRGEGARAPQGGVPREPRAGKAGKLEITFSYWDGGHRRKVEVLKGDSIGQFLPKAREKPAKEFREMKTAGTDGLMYIKEDLILPQNVTFYDLIVNKARGKRAAVPFRCP